MTQKERLKILKSRHWKEEECPISIHILDHWKTFFLEARNVYRKDFVSATVYLVIDNYVFELVPYKESKKCLEWALRKFRENRTYLKKKNKEFKKVIGEIKKNFALIKKGLSPFSNQELKNLFIKIFKLGRKQYSYSIISEGADVLDEEDYLKLLPHIKKEKALEIIRVLSSPFKLSFLEKEKLKLLKIAKEAALNKKLKGAVTKKSLNAVKEFPQFFRKLETHTQNYFWIQNSFRGASYLGKKYFLSEIAELILKHSLQNLRKEIKKLTNKKERLQKAQNQIYKKYKIKKDAKSFFGLIRYFVTLQDNRKENVLRLVFCIDQILNEAAERFKVPRPNLDDYFVPEVKRLLNKGKKVPKEILRKRKKGVVFFCFIANNKINVDRLAGKEAKEIALFYKERRKALAAPQIIKGFVASEGKGGKKLKGKVRIVFDPKKDKFYKGEILVTGMTRPEFVPLMRKAKAVITNEGGITTHAAIISRELKIPCIIGTKVATDVLKNGDNIQLDLKKGTVTVIARKEQSD